MWGGTFTDLTDCLLLVRKGSRSFMTLTGNCWLCLLSFPWACPSVYCFYPDFILWFQSSQAGHDLISAKSSVLAAQTWLVRSGGFWSLLVLVVGTGVGGCNLTEMLKPRYPPSFIWEKPVERASLAPVCRGLQLIRAVPDTRWGVTSMWKPWDTHTLACRWYGSGGQQGMYWVNSARIWMRQELHSVVGTRRRQIYGDWKLGAGNMSHTENVESDVKNKWEAQLFGLCSFYVIWERLVCCAIQGSSLLVQKPFRSWEQLLAWFFFFSFSQWFLQASHLPLFDDSIIHSSSQMKYGSILVLKEILCI